MSIIKFSSITFTSIKNDIESFLKKEYNKAGVLFSPASPYGNILSVVTYLYQVSILYLKNSLNQLDLSKANSNNPNVIRNAAIFAGHNPMRSISATGTIKLTLKSDASIEDDIPGSRVTIPNKLLIRNITNSLEYSVNIGSDNMVYRITPNYSFFIPIIQGKWKSRSFTSSGEQLQSFNISEKGNKDVENFNVEVIVGGDIWSIKKHIWEMLPNEESCVVRTGFDGGIDIIFGNEGFGKVPSIGTKVEVNYLSSDGSKGNIFRRTRNDWDFIGDAIDAYGDSVDFKKVFNIDIYTDINFGADEENLQFTKNLLPISSNNFVLGLPQQYAYEIKKLGVFSHVNAYEKSGTIFIVATPNVRLFKNQNSDYFTIDKKAFYLDRYEKSKISKYLKTGGNLQLTKKYRIDSPKLSYYVANVFVMSYSDATDDSVNSQIMDKISEYFLNLNRTDRIPKLDIIKELSSIDDIHSVDISFISKKNEDYHREYLIKKSNKEKLKDSKSVSDISKKDIDYNPHEKLGLDPVLGDIIFEPEELPIIRGGWYDSNDIYYSDDLSGNQMKSVNIIKKGKIDSSKRNS